LAGRLVERPCTTFAGGLATERPGQLSLNVLIRRLTTLGLVTEADLYAAVVLGVRLTGVLLEGAGAAPLALLDRHHDQIPGERVVLVASGSWISTGQLEEALSRGASP